MYCRPCLQDHHEDTSRQAGGLSGTVASCPRCWSILSASTPLPRTADAGEGGSSCPERRPISSASFPLRQACKVARTRSLLPWALVLVHNHSHVGARVAICLGQWSIPSVFTPPRGDHGMSDRRAISLCETMGRCRGHNTRAICYKKVRVLGLFPDLRLFSTNPITTEARP